MDGWDEREGGHPYKYAIEQSNRVNSFMVVGRPLLSFCYFLSSHNKWALIIVFSKLRNLFAVCIEISTVVVANNKTELGRRTKRWQIGSRDTLIPLPVQWQQFNCILE